MQHHFKTFATDFQLILDRASEWRARIEMIKNARRFLYVSTYYIEYDNYAIEFFSELTKAVGRGVRVTVVIDAFGQKLSSNLMAKTGRRLLRKAFDAFHKNGGEIICYRPPKILQKLLGTGYHIKYQVSEEGRILFASSNISQMSYNRWFEFAVMLNGPVSVIMLEDLFQILENPNREDLDFLKRQIQNQAVAKEQNYAFEFFTYVPAIDPSPFSPIRQYWTNPITTGLIKSINQAQKKIELTSFYFKPHPKLFDAIESAAKRGVRVEIHHSHRGALAGVTRLPWLAASARYPRLLRQSVKIYEHLQGQHTKFVLIDDRIAWLGSYNFEHSADDRLAEAMLVTEDAMIVKEIRTFFDELKNDEQSQPVDENFISKLPVCLRLYRLLCLPIKRWL